MLSGENKDKKTENNFKQKIYMKKKKKKRISVYQSFVYAICMVLPFLFILSFLVGKSFLFFTELKVTTATATKNIEII